MEPSVSEVTRPVGSVSRPAIDRPHSQLDAQDASRFRNFVVLVLQQVTMRTGWIFKTETVVIPAVLDSISGAGWIRGWLPLLNRFGHSVPPLLLARAVSAAPLKKWALLFTTALYAVTIFCLAALFVVPVEAPDGWLPMLFLSIYAVFFMAVGVNQVVFNTLQGKLVATTRRGRLLLVSNVLGAVVSVGCALWLLPAWLRAEPPRFDLVFGFTGLAFACSAALALLLVERPDRDRVERSRMRFSDVFLDAWSTVRDDRNFRRLALVGAAFGTSLMLFPHYQNVGLRGMDLQISHIIGWVVVQNIGTGLFSLPAGWIADRHGNRLVLQCALLGVAAAPPVTIALCYWDVGAAFTLVFLLLGLNPVVFRTLQNFTLEVAAADDHPRYLSTLSLCIGLPMLLSPLVGWGIDAAGFQVVFGLITSTVLLGWLATFRLFEPRDRVTINLLNTSSPNE